MKKNVDKSFSMLGTITQLNINVYRFLYAPAKHINFECYSLIQTFVKTYSIPSRTTTAIKDRNNENKNLEVILSLGIQL